MIAYNPQWLDALAVRKQSRKWYNKGLLSGIEIQAIQEKFQAHFYTPNTFVRIGLGIFCWILVSSVFGLFGMAVIESFKSKAGTGVICILFGIILIAALEFFIREKKYYQAGIDDALLYMALSLTIIGISLIFTPVFEEFEVLYCLVALPLLAIAAVRYTDTVVTAFTFVCLTAIIFFTFKESTLLAKFIPLACMVLSTSVYLIIQKYKNREELRFWANCLMVLEACSLLLFYVSGNYFVVEDLGEMLFTGYTIPFSIIFWVFTAIIPLAYVYFGLKKLDRLLLRIGLLLIALSVVTFKYYFSLGHYEVTLTIAGALLIVLAYYSIRYLKTNPQRFTYTEDRSDENAGLENTEALIIAQTSGAPSASDKGFIFGGGSFGGGGAGGSF